MVAVGKDLVAEARKEAQCAEVHQPRGAAAGNGAQQLQAGKQGREEDVAESLLVSSTERLALHSCCVRHTSSCHGTINSCACLCQGCDC
jgi:hypothetical protein